MRLTDITKELFDYLVAFRQKVAQASVPDIEILRHELESVFYSMEAKLAEHPKLLSEYRQVKYPLVALADEIVLTSSWHEAKRWEQCLLERKYFNTNIAGNQFFKLLKRVEQMPTSVLIIYFYCLAFGFRGGFSPNDPSLLRLKTRLVGRIVPRQKKNEDKIFPAAYDLVISGNRVLPKLWRWRHLLVASLLCFGLLLGIERLVIWPSLMGWSVESVEPSSGAGEVGDGQIISVKDPSSAASAGNETVSEASTGASTYTVQLGSFTSETLAKHFSMQIEQTGIKTRIIVQTEGKAKPSYLVLSGTFDNEGDALSLLKKAEGATTLVTKMRVQDLSFTQGECISGCI